MIVLIMGLIALILGIILVLVDSKLNKESKYLKFLPGYNCGTCGYAGCSGMADAMESDIDAYKKCRLLKGEKLKELEDYINSKKAS